MNEEYVLATIVISYLCKKTNEPKFTYLKVEDCYPSLVNTNHVLNFAKSNDRYEVLSKEYSLEEAHFTDIDLDLCNTTH
jgi:hypothetical protein